MMNFIVVAIFALLAVAAHADNGNFEIDWSKVVPVTELPGFWKGRLVRPFLSGQITTRNQRIVGGEIVTPHSHPYQAGLLMSFDTGTGLCGGSIISSRSILSAAHCLAGSQSTQVILGAHQITNVEPSQQRQTVPLEAYFIHEDYNPQTFWNDIAMLTLPETAILNEFVRLSVLPIDISGEAFIGELTTVTGWGRTSDNSPETSAFLRSTQNNVISNVQCQEVYEATVIDSTLCVSTTGGRSACSGDSGGPLTIVRNGEIVQIGIAIFVSSAGCEAGVPGGFARVTSFLDWINQRVVN